MTDSQNGNMDFGAHQFQRNHYFYGKLMTVRDFEAEQGYMNGKRYLLNRVLDGAGIICGIDNLEVYTKEGQDKLRVRFQNGGVALDGNGREIVVPDGSDKEILIREGEATVNLPLSALAADPYYLYLEYTSREGELVNAASGSSSCDETCCPNRVIEDFLVIASRSEPIVPSLVIPAGNGEEDTDPGGGEVECPAIPYDAGADTVKRTVKEWLKHETDRLCREVPEDAAGVFCLALEQGDEISINEGFTADHLTFVSHRKALEELLKCHLIDFDNPHEVTALQTGALVSINGASNADGNVDLEPLDAVTINVKETPGENPGDPVVKSIVIGESHSSLTGNPHQTKHAELDEVKPVDPATIPDATRDKHVSNDDAAKWNGVADNPRWIKSIDGVENGDGDVDLVPAGAIQIIPDNAGNIITIGEDHSGDHDNPHHVTTEQIEALSTSGGFVSGPVIINSNDWSALAGNATETYGVMGRLTQDLETGSSYRTSGLVGISEIEGKHGVYAKAPKGTHALYVEGSAFFSGPKSGYVVDVFKNGSGKNLKSGDLVKLKSKDKAARYFGEDNKIPVVEVTLADKNDDPCLMGIVDRVAIPEQEGAGGVTGSGDTVKGGEELFVVTLGCYARCKVDASKGSIEVGDLLTSSTKAGHAVKAADPKLGCILGKALEPLKKGTGTIAVFVNLQ